MDKIKLKKINEFNEKEQERIFLGLYSAYKHVFSKHPDAQREYWDNYSFFKNDVKKNGKITVLEYNGRILGAANILITRKSLTIESLFALPSKIFFKQNKQTVGNFLLNHFKKVAREKNILFKTTTPSPAAKKTLGKIKRKPKRRINLTRRKQ